MKTQSFVLTIGVVLLSIGIGMGMLSNAQDASGKGEEMQAADYRVSGPYTHDNLTIFLVHGTARVTGKNFLPLQEALAQKKVVVYETKDVNELAIENRSAEDVYVQSGDIVKGGQQDRMMAVDLIVPPKSGRMRIAAFCVESGRWSGRGTEQAAVFTSSADVASAKEIKLAAKVSNSQGDVWKNVTATQDKLSANVGERVNSVVSESSLQLATENRKVQANADNYIKELSHIVYTKDNIIGYVFAINGKLNSADIYASSALFRSLWPKLLKASAIEAIAELRAGQKFEPVTEENVQVFLSEAEKGNASEKEVTARIKLVTRESDQNVFFETRDRAQKDAWVHRNYIRKN